MMYQKLLDLVAASSVAPPLFEPGEPAFWNDPHISSSMLRAHLDPTNDVASRCPETIDRTVAYWFREGLLKPGMKVLDLGCGPGLYAERLCRAGAIVVGLDISERSLEYARGRAAEAQLPVEYRCMDFLTMEYVDAFDAVIQVYGELCTFSDEKRDTLLRLIHRALRKKGQLIFDVTTRALRMRAGLRSGWYVSNGGFWRPGRHLVLEQGYDYPTASVWLDQFIVIDDRSATIYRNWFHDYSLDVLSSALTASGFVTTHVWNDLTGSAFAEGGDWIAVAAEKSP